ncbi:MAG: polyprenyl diphosphate synthase [Neomegalonema sp.]|nr:polyprenyl diphosphate synthase [Neomegalonema sp.]
MDGNGRWARAHGLDRLEGHRRGAESVREAIRACPDLGVEVLTLYAFSTENWRRPAEEVSGLMELFRVYFAEEAESLIREGVRVTFLGDPTRLPADVQSMMCALEKATQEGRQLRLVVALNYGARAEIANAARRLAEQVAEGALAAEDVTEEALASALETADLPDPDLVIRTSGEQRLSNFLLWQAAYAEFIFLQETWPEFTQESFAKAVRAFRARDRRFGASFG